MAKDVHQAIKDVLVKERHISQEEAGDDIASNETATTLSTRCLLMLQCVKCFKVK